MKHQTQIAEELRSQGRKFSQTKLRADLSAYKPIFEHGRAKLYDDEVLNTLLALYPVRKPVIIDVPESDELYPPSQFDRIESMLSAICKDLNIAVH